MSDVQRFDHEGYPVRGAGGVFVKSEDYDRLAAELAEVREIQRRNYGRGTELHMEMCVWAAAYDKRAASSAGPALSGMQVVIGPTMPEGTAELRCGESRVPIVPSAGGNQS